MLRINRLSGYNTKENNWKTYELYDSNLQQYSTVINLCHSCPLIALLMSTPSLKNYFEVIIGTYNLFALYILWQSPLKGPM